MRPLTQPSWSRSNEYKILHDYMRSRCEYGLAKKKREKKSSASTTVLPSPNIIRLAVLWFCRCSIPWRRKTQKLCCGQNLGKPRLHFAVTSSKDANVQISCKLDAIRKDVDMLCACYVHGMCMEGTWCVNGFSRFWHQTHPSWCYAPIRRCLHCFIHMNRRTQ